jgi:hypothetical protein
VLPYDDKIAACLRPSKRGRAAGGIAGDRLVVRVADDVPNLILGHAMFDDDMDVVAVFVVLQVSDDNRLIHGHPSRHPAGSAALSS